MRIEDYAQDDIPKGKARYDLPYVSLRRLAGLLGPDVHRPSIEVDDLLRWSRARLESLISVGPYLEHYPGETAKLERGLKMAERAMREASSPATKVDDMRRQEVPLQILVKRIMNDPRFLPTHAELLSAVTQSNLLEINQSKDKNEKTYEYLNEDHLNLLADYLVKRIQEHGASQKRPFRILEIGAGDGRLSHFLRKKLEERAPGQTQIVATDSMGGYEGSYDIKPVFPVEKARHDEAIERYNPDIVICSWMTRDLTSEIRANSNVKEYILIGVPNTSVSGDLWGTWGIDPDHDHFGGDDPDEYEEHGPENIPTYKKDGWTKTYLEGARPLQVCFMDNSSKYSPGGIERHSDTTLFKRN